MTQPQPILKRTPVSLLVAAVRQLRPKQWTKNVVFLSPALVFSGQFLQPEPVIELVIAIGAFSMLASAGYILNDLMDREADRNHPKKRFRPIASGALPVSLALVLFVACLVAGVAASLWLSVPFLAVALLYLTTTLSYSFYFKHVVILDVLVLSSGFVWRIIAGALAIEVAVSEWLFLCTVFVALFFGFNKRRAELINVGAASGTRKNLAEYSPQMLEQIQAIVTSATIITYLLYTVQGPTPWMTLTIPFVLYGIFRYIYLIEQQGEGGAPDETLLRDPPMLVTGLLYLLVAVGVLLGNEVGLLPTLLE
ncbi:MAG: decaprenyl-phosphate phosphoribosyltransferase [Myxococcales bacterium]|nr:decaprenyl-phosphate phosphoribosyltransferase [Myxococcales bacterium]